jgi:uncharacterized membrane protein YbaN (DUF454 family)
MNMLTPFSIDPAGLADLAGLGSPGDRFAMPKDFPDPIAPPPKRELEPEFGLSIEHLDGSGFLRVRDPRLLAPGREGFCIALLEAAVTQWSFRQAEIDLASATCRLEFDPERMDRAQVAQLASQAIQMATPSLQTQRNTFWRGEPEWTSLFGFAAADGSRPSIWETRTVGPARLRLRNRNHVEDRVANRSTSLLQMWPGIRASDWRPTLAGDDLDVEFDPQVLNSRDVVLAAEAALRVARAESDCPETSNLDHTSLVDHLKSFASWDVVLAGSSMLLAGAGVVLPGIPSVPFFVLGCHALCRAYPQLKPWLHSIPGVGQILRSSKVSENHWSDPHFVAKTLIIGVLVAGFLLIVHPPFPLVLACELGMMFFSIH